MWSYKTLEEIEDFNTRAVAIMNKYPHRKGKFNPILDHLFENTKFGRVSIQLQETYQSYYFINCKFVDCLNGEERELSEIEGPGYKSFINLKDPEDALNKLESLLERIVIQEEVEEEIPAPQFTIHAWWDNVEQTA